MASKRTYRRAARARGITLGQLDQLRRTRGLTLHALQRLPDPALRRAVRRLEYPDLARARETFRLRQARGGATPSRGALSAALRQLDSSRARAAAQATVAGVPTGREVQPRALLPRTAGLGPGPGGWVALGPGNIGGRTRSIVVHPTSPGVMWAGSVAGGVWRTDDAGQSWEPVDDFMANLAVACMAIDPTDPNVVYAGTGEGFFNVDAVRGAGIFRTVDGTTWQQLAATTGPDFAAVNRLAISADGTTLLAATAAGIFRSTDRDRVGFTNVLADEIADVKFHPTDSRRAVAGGLRNGEAYHTTDGGETWKPATHAGSWSGRVELAYAVKDPRRVYASVQGDTGELWRSGTDGRSYTRRRALADGQPAQYLGDQGWYGNAVWAADPTDANLVILGGVDLWRSTDGGNTLSEISFWWEDASAHADQHAIVADPGYDGKGNRTVYFGNDGGLYKADDVTTVGSDDNRVEGWTKLDNSYGVTQFYSGAGHVSTGAIVGGAQDNGTLLYTPAHGSEGWSSMFGGDGGWCAADPSDDSVFYGEYVFLNIHRSTDGGASADYISGQFWNGSEWTWKPVPYRIPDAKSNSALFIAPFALDPNEPNRLLAGGLTLWRTNDAKTPNTNSTGPSWSAIKASTGQPISALAIAADDSDTIWVGHDDGALFATSNGTAAHPAWRAVQGAATGRYCTGITIDPHDKAVVYATFGGYTTGNLWRTTDAGATWSNLGAALPAAPVRALAVHPDRSELLYLGAEVGLFASEDGGATWSPTNEGPTNCSVDDLFWMDRALICVTHGRGMFKIDLGDPSR